jgi:tetratricopeptide (TPR) repeat protein
MRPRRLVSFASTLAEARERPTDPDVLAELARSALQEGEEERGLAAIALALTQCPTARLWQWKGLLERSIDDHEKAIASFQAAARMDPSDPGIAHGLARVVLEAGLPAEHLYEHARRLAPADGSVLIGLAAARFASGRGEHAEAELDAALRRAPLWMDGHRQLAQLKSMLGDPQSATASVERALIDLPQHPGLWQVLFDLRLKSEDFGSLDDDVAKAASAGVDGALLRPYEAIAAAERGDRSRADRLSADGDGTGGEALGVWQIRHFLRSGRFDQALEAIERELAGPRAAQAWPYAAIAWRLLGDPRSEWLERDGKLVSVLDLREELPPLDRLAEVLRSIHVAKAEYLDQSVRGGTQSDGPLFSRLEPELRSVRSAVVTAIERYVAQLPSLDTGHPLLSRRRDRRVRFAGSWSVRLQARGFHVSHVHPQGWISSALYVALPPVQENSPANAGWLQLGQPPSEIGVSLEPLAVIEPKPGRLVLFPSWIWHGTIPFPAGDRLTVAFDVSPPV